MDDISVAVIPEIVTLTPTCHDSDISTMTATGEGDTDGEDNDSTAESECGSDASPTALRRKIERLGKQENKRKRAMAELRDKLKDAKQARQGRRSTEKKVTQIKDLAPANTLPLGKMVSLNNYFRDTVFRRLKLVTKDVIKDGSVVRKIMEHLQVVTDWDKNNYRAHIEMALQTKIGQYRDNSVKNIKWKYRTAKGKGPGKFLALVRQRQGSAIVSNQVI